MTSEDQTKHQYQLLKEKDIQADYSEISSFDVESGINTPRLSIKSPKKNFAENEVKPIF